jgi:hypothetical protein
VCLRASRDLTEKEGELGPAVINTHRIRSMKNNLACVAMSENPVRREYSRHIDIRRYFVRDLVAQNVLKLIPLRTSLMVADALTKSLPPPAHAKHRETMIGLVPFSVPFKKKSVPFSLRVPFSVPFNAKWNAAN